MNKKNIRTGELLLIEDTPSLQMLYSTILRRAGFSTHCAGSAREGLELFSQHNHKVVLLDLMLPDLDGLEVIGALLSRKPQTRIIVITANGTVSKAVEATRAGACEFIVKPLGDVRLISAVANAFAEANRDDHDFRTSSLGSMFDHVFDGNSEAINDVRRVLNSVAKSAAPIFIKGEAGTGKEHCARAVHAKSSRTAQRFISLNCAAITPEQMEAEILGRHLAANSQSGADPDSVTDEESGAISGTLFLGNVTEMPNDVQGRLLHLLQSSTLTSTRTGAPLPVNLRIICASTRSPEAEMHAQRLREDLFYRLYVIPVQMPRLRDRSADIEKIATGILARIASEEGKNFKAFERDVLELFRELPWPGNLRQLISVLRHVVVLNSGNVVTMGMLPGELINMSSNANGAISDGRNDQMDIRATDLREHDSLRGMTMGQIERYAIERAIERHGGSVPRAARELDLAPSTIYRKREHWSGRDG